MTKYHGGKQRIGEKIAKAISTYSEKISSDKSFEIKGYCEPFCGMLGVYKYIPTLLVDNRIEYKAGDINKSVICMWKALQKGWNPTDSVNKEEYQKIKDEPIATKEKGFYGHAYTYRGRFLDSYFPHRSQTIKHNLNNVLDISKKLKRVTFKSGDYKQFSNLEGYIIYCDPPYEKTVCRYSRGVKKEELVFNTEEFWEWCLKMSDKNIIFISSYEAPKEFTEILSIKSKITGSKGIDRTEKLYFINTKIL